MFLAEFGISLQLSTTLDVLVTLYMCTANASKAATTSDVREYLLDIYYHFDNSCKLMQDLRDFFVFCNVEIQKVLNHTVTRWLSQAKYLDRNLQLWDGLRSSFFLTKLDDDEDGIEKAYVLFFQAAKPAFTVLENYEPTIHVPRQQMLTFFSAVALKLVRVQVLRHISCRQMQL